MNKLPRMYFAMKKQKDDVHQIYLYDEVTEIGNFNWETWSYEESETSAKRFQQMLDEIPEDGKIELYINSCGGSVKEGTAIFNQLKRHKAYKTGYVDGAGHSIAFTILQACDWRVMGEGTSALIHEPWTAVAGNARQLRDEADNLDALTQSSISLFMNRAKNITEKELRKMLEKETMLTPDMALEYGLIDEIGGKKEENPADPEKDPKKDPEEDPEEDPKEDPEEDPQKDPEDMGKQLVEAKEMFRRNTSFSKERKEFEKLVKGNQAKQEKGVSYMDAFFNIFS